MTGFDKAFSPERSRRLSANGKILSDPYPKVINDRILSNRIPFITLFETHKIYLYPAKFAIMPDHFIYKGSIAHVV